MIQTKSYEVVNDTIVKVQSYTTNEWYEVDLVKMKCECKGFKYKYSKKSKFDPGRLCIHMKIVEHLLKPDGILLKDRKTIKGVRFLYTKAKSLANLLETQIKQHPIEKYEFCGSYRRKQSTIGDMDLLVCMKTSKVDPEGLCAFKNFADALNIFCDRSLVFGPTTCRFVKNDIQLDLKLVPKDAWPYALLHYTGNAKSNIILRGTAKRRSWKLNEYGLYDENSNLIKCKTEKDVFDKLGKKWLEPEERQL
jgi:DNA polymerase/3'-5' exonuclease PolX